MFSLEPSIPFILLLVTNVLELVGFLSSHMVDNRYLSSVHEGIFQRCTSLRHNMDYFICYWWSADTFMEDKSNERKEILQNFRLLLFLSRGQLIISQALIWFLYFSFPIKLKPASLQACTILAFITLFLVGFVFVFGVFGYFYKKIRTKKFQYLLSSLMFLNGKLNWPAPNAWFSFIL